MTADDILEYCLDNFEGSVVVNSWGERGVFYNPENKLKRGVYILTVKEKDGDNDKASCLNRENIWRLNIGVKKETFKKLFGLIPGRPEKGGVVDMNYDFSAINQILPHPVYGWMGWICILNPTTEAFEELKEYIDEAYQLSKEKYKKRNCSI